MSLEFLEDFFYENPFYLILTVIFLVMLAELIKYLLLQDELRYLARNAEHNRAWWRQQLRNFLATDRKRRIGG